MKGRQQTVSAVKGREHGRGRLWGVVLLLLAAVMALVAGRLRGCGGSPELTPRAERGTAREMALQTIDGPVWQLNQQRGRVVLVNLWATWCGPCREEIPDLQRLADEAGGPVVVGVSLDDGADRVQRVRDFARRFGVRYPLALSGSNLALTGGVEGVPTTMLFDREGRLAKVYVGEAARRVLERDVHALEAER